MEALGHWTFWATALIIVATPGTGALYTIAAGLARGPAAGVLAAFASTLGIVPHLIAALTGLAAILHASAVAFNAVKYAGVAYLLYMAWQMFRDTGGLNLANSDAEKPVSQVLREGVILNLLNPKLSIFFVAFLPQFIAVDDPAPIVSMLALSAAFMAMTFVVFAAYGIFAGAMRREVISRPNFMRWIQRSFAGLFAGMAVKLALTER